MKRAQALRRSWSGAAASSRGAPRRERRGRGGAGRWSRRNGGGVRRRALRRLLVRVGELHGPGALFASVDLEKPGAVKAAGEAILRATDREFLVARAHERLSRPFAAAVIVDCIDIVEAGREFPAQQGLATAGGNVPPTLRRPAFPVLVADGHPDFARFIVAQAKI